MLHPQRVDRENLIRTESITDEMLSFLEMCVCYGVSYVVAGRTSSGKTTLLNSLLGTVPDYKRIYTIENGARELSLIKRDVSGRIKNNVVHTLTSSLPPVLAILFAMMPFMYLMRSVGSYNKHVREDLEMSLSLVTTAYIDCDNLKMAIGQYVNDMRPSMQGVFREFLGEVETISPNMEEAIYHMKDKIDNAIFKEWCDQLVACQSDGGLKDTLPAIVSKLRDERLVNSELRTMLAEVRREYYFKKRNTHSPKACLSGRKQTHKEGRKSVSIFTNKKKSIPEDAVPATVEQAIIHFNIIHFNFQCGNL